MNKLPVGDTIRFAYAFTLGEIGTIIGLIWIPTVINAVAGFLLTRFASPPDAAAMAGAQTAITFLFIAATLVLSSVMAVAVTKQALGMRKGPAIAHFSLGAPEWRVLGGIMGLYLILMAFIFGFALIGGIVVAAGVLMKGAEAMMASIAATLGLLGFCAMIYIFVRLSFLFVPAAVNEGEFGLTRSWQMTRGNFWRIFAVGLAVLVPIMMVSAVAQYFILGPDYFATFSQMMADPANAQKYQAQLANLQQASMPLLLGTGLLLAPLMQGLAFAAPAFAYRTLSGKGIAAESE